VVLLKPECLEAGLCEPILNHIAERFQILDHRHISATWEQISSHYDDMITSPRRETITWCDPEADIRDRYVGNPSGFALVHGPGATAALRAMLGHFDPAQADPTSIRGRWGTDTSERAMAEGRMTRNLIHSSDDEKGALKEFRLWYGEANAHLLTTKI
jgi:nucleoside-diphosphate kinase